MNNFDKHILVPIDFSPGAADVVEAAETLAVAENCGLVILHVVEPFDAMRQRPPLVLTDVLKDYARLVYRLPSHRVRVLALEGEPVETIMDAAIASRCSIIVMGHGGKNGNPGHVASAIEKHFHGRTHLIARRKKTMETEAVATRL